MRDAPRAESRDGGESRRAQLFKGVAEMALLALLKERAHYGLEILDRLAGEAGLQLADGTIYPLLHRLERAGLVAAEWRLEDEAGSRPRKYYALTPKGAAELGAMVDEWRRLSGRLGAFLNRGTS
jgi:PadR family transcriptional regulator PadR